MIVIRIPAFAAGAAVGALVVECLGMWEPLAGSWRWEPLVAIAGLGVVSGEIATILADEDDVARGSIDGAEADPT